MSINITFKNSDKNDVKFWRSVGVSIDLINELSTSDIGIRFKSMLNNVTINELSELATLLNVDLKDVNKKEQAECFNEVPINSQKEIILLREFLNRKKRTVIRYYNYVSTNSDYETIFKHSQVCQLYQLFNNDHIHIIQIYTWHNWNSKGTGIQFSLSKKVSFDKAYKIPTEYATDFVDDMYTYSNRENKYKVFSFGKHEKEKLVVMLYRQINDASRPDFDEPFRNKEVVSIMFQIDVTAGLLEIRSKFQKEKEGIKKYIEKTFDTSLIEIKPEVFNQYQPEKVISAVLEGTPPENKEVLDFMVNKVVFRSSPLINSPSLTFELKNGDVLPSIKDAYTRECIDLESIKDIESISFKTSKVSRTIRSTVLEDGNIIFSLDDSGIEQETKNDIEEKFLFKFGIPLNKLVSNSKFTVGKADLTDYLMTISLKKAFTDIEQEIFGRLIQDKIIFEGSEIIISCENSNCDYTESISSELKECPSCGNPKLRKDGYSSVNISIKSVQGFVKELIKSFCNTTDWKLSKDTEKTYYKSKYKFINLDNRQTNESLQILIHQGAIQNRVLEKINRSLTPTVIVFVGMLEKNIEKYDNNCIFPINFGRVYNMENPEEFFEKIYESIEHRAKSYLSSVAAKSLEILENLPKPELIGKSYSPSDFEDDVFNILKDLFPNADKWGNKMSGKEVPEGIFALSYTVTEGGEDKQHQYVFSYDCKLNKNTNGYDLSKGEQRKAFDYVEMLNQIRHITKFSNKKQLSAHIFISNNFDTNNYETMARHFYSKLPSGYDTRPIFLPIEVLTFLHSEYRKNHQKLYNARNIFMENLHKILITDKLVVEKDDIEELMEEALDEKLADYSVMDTVKVRKNVIKKLKK
ncbi:hypothetical protein GH892_18930 [Bacillus thuringiensis]|uniref:hypothetical protein n=1 Tax=Bacillus thuringiensis TaxID=1428 RepID=UPI00139ED4B0|nr:hypothetical protein [Bacillus thuringiensis]MCR6856266.1 hypothetical protein [Bacillus thuringiensis]MEB8835576.1 hypothetical protein [Bacillus cereus]MEC3036772.1 hypothetical protein [Bacillus cereus]MRA85504.1 hypothetical protein [Bacillus thuringiensis]